MSSRYQSTGAIASGSIAAGATLNINATGLPSLFNIHKITVVPDSAGGSFDYRIYKADTFAAAKLLALWDNVANGTTGLVDPMDDTSGVPAAANEGAGIPYDDDDDTGELHHQLINNDGTSHSYTITILYEEVPKVVSVGSYQARSTAPRWMWYEDGVGADLKAWDAIVDASVLSFRTRTDADGAGVTWMTVTRGSTTAVTSVAIAAGGATVGTFQAAEFNLASAATLSWSTDLFIRRDDANVLAQRNGTTAQALRIYNTFTDASNYERFNAVWSSNILFVGVGYGGTGVSRAMRFTNGGGSGQWELTTAGHLEAVTDNSYDVGTASQRARTGYFGTALNVGLATNATGNLYAGSDSLATATFDTAVTSAVGSTFTFRKARGTQASRTIVADDDVVGSFDFQAIEDATDYRTVAQIIAKVGGTPGAAIDMPGKLEFYTTPDASTTPALAMTITRTQTIAAGLAANAVGQFYAGSNVQSSVYYDTAVDSAVGSALLFRKARGTQAARTIVADGDTLGSLYFYGIEDSTDYRIAAQIQAKIDGTPGAATDMPGRLEFYTTPDASVTPTLALTINALQNSVFGGYIIPLITDTNGTVEGSIWYDASEDKLKFKTAAGVETITSA